MHALGIALGVSFLTKKGTGNREQGTGNIKERTVKEFSVRNAPFPWELEAPTNRVVRNTWGLNPMREPSPLGSCPFPVAFNNQLHLAMIPVSFSNSDETTDPL